MLEFYNPNPVGRMVGDCAVRAVSKALDISWEDAYLKMCKNGFLMGDMPSSDTVWGAILREEGFKRSIIPDSCPQCYTAEDFANDNPKGTFVLGFGGHCVCIKDGIIFDSWDSSKEIPTYVWHK